MLFKKRANPDSQVLAIKKYPRRKAGDKRNLEKNY
jgi:hypothetical protein